MDDAIMFSESNSVRLILDTQRSDQFRACPQALIVSTLFSFTKYDGPSTGIFLASKNCTYLKLWLYLELCDPYHQQSCPPRYCSPTKMIEDACAIIVQAAAFAAAETVHKEEEPSSVSSCVGRIAVGRVRRSVHEVYHCLGSSYFQRAYRMSYESFWNLHTTSL